MRIIHIATFKGNIGDKINHNGFYRIINKIYKDVEITQIELRNFYFSAKERMFFDESFANDINEYDLCILGGGGFFDAQWANSNTGVTLDLPDEFIYSIRIPVLVNAMGYHEYPGVTNIDICNKFEKFLSIISLKKNWLVTVRNDGSYERLLERYGKDIMYNICKVADNGFFCNFSPETICDKDNTTIGMCVSNDLFSKEYNKNVDTTLFNKQMAMFINNQVIQNRRVILFPHTPNDVNVIGELFLGIDNQAKRNSIIIAPYDASSEHSIKQISEFYNKCDCIIGMRFHSLITAINLRIPAIALAGHMQIEALYDDLSLSKYCVKVNNTDFDKELEIQVNEALNNREKIRNIYDDLYSSYLENLYVEYMEKIEEFCD